MRLLRTFLTFVPALLFALPAPAQTAAPTYGVTAVGANVYASNTVNFWLPISVTGTTTLSSCSVYFSAGDAASPQFQCYLSAVGGVPLVCSSGVGTAVAGSWANASFAACTLPAGTYSITVLNAGPGNAVVYNSTVGACYTGSNPFGSAPATQCNPLASPTWGQPSFYVTAAAAAPSPSPPVAIPGGAGFVATVTNLQFAMGVPGLVSQAWATIAINGATYTCTYQQGALGSAAYQLSCVTPPPAVAAQTPAGP